MIWLSVEPSPPAKIDPYLVSPGIYGFMTFLVLAICGWLLFSSFSRHIRKATFHADEREEELYGEASGDRRRHIPIDPNLKPTQGPYAQTVLGQRAPEYDPDSEAREELERRGDLTSTPFPRTPDGIPSVWGGDEGRFSEPYEKRAEIVWTTLQELGLSPSFALAGSEDGEVIMARDDARDEEHLVVVIEDPSEHELIDARIADGTLASWLRERFEG